MKRIISVLLGLISFVALLTAQNNNPGLDSLSQLSRHGQLPQLIQAANSLLAGGNLSSSDKGIALTYLAYGYQQSGDLHHAVASYEQALAVINRDGLHTAEYATALAALATLYAESGAIDTAKHVLLRSIHIFEQQGDHAAIAGLWNDLATIAADEHSSRDAHKYLAHALAESQLAGNITQDQLAAITSTQARIAQLDGDPTSAISDYQRSLALWKQSHGDQQPQTGWLYVLLGEAWLQSGNIAAAHDATLHGLQILQATSGDRTPRFFAAQLAYSKILDASGSHAEASTLRTSANSGLTDLTRASQNQISISALR
ncbi:MAG TPA: tetratricopeptide repeat protein [Acidobacteriaceae bacterium]|nr:tetratricopeptide repeat protein [Acidobacteriaceae bacterium]